MTAVENRKFVRDYADSSIYLYRDTETNRFEYSPPLTPTMKRLVKGIQKYPKTRSCPSPMPSQPKPQPKPQPQSFSYTLPTPSNNQVAVEQQRCKIPVPYSQWVNVKGFGNYESTPIPTAKLLYYPKLGERYLSNSRTNMHIAQSSHPQISTTSVSVSIVNVQDKSAQHVISPINVEFSE